MKKAVIFCVVIILFGLAAAAGKYMEPKDKKETIPIFNALTGKVEEVGRIRKTDAQWKKELPGEVYRVTRQKGTEAPFSGTCEVGHSGGAYKCICCGTDLFGVGTKFESGTGWPSFWTPVSSLNVVTEADKSLGMDRTEVLCARCGAHLGHLFEDGPPPTNKRYCINGVALKFVESPGPIHRTETAAFGAGCFWGVEESFRKIEGVVYTQVGYMGGTMESPTYEDVCTDRTGHAETVLVIYDSAKIKYDNLLGIFWRLHDPTTLNRQGPDEGSQYRSVIFYYDKTQRDAAVALKKEFEKAGLYNKKRIVTEIVPASEFYPAEEYHQRYHEKRGGGSCRF